MITEIKNKRFLVWNTNLSKTAYTPMVFRLKFNRHSNEVEFKPVGNLLNTYSYSVQELESMLQELKEINKELVDNNNSLWEK